MAHDRRVTVSLEGEVCVTQAALREAVESRGASIEEDAPVRLRVRVTGAVGTDGAASGRVGVDVSGANAKGPIAARSLVASSCTDAIDALALLVALAADEAPREAPLPDEPRAIALPPVADRRDAPREAPAEASTKGAASSVYASAAVAGTTLAEGQVGARLGVGLAWDRTFLPWAEASVGATLPRSVSGGGGDASLTWATGRLAIAPLSVTLGERLRASAYAAGEAGVLHGSGSGPERVSARTRPWLAAIGGGRVQWQLGGRLVAGLEVAAVVPLLRDQFVFINGGTAYRVPALALETAISLGLRFP